jgi:N6-L-threonylcarbamoyladenine synthase
MLCLGIESTAHTFSASVAELREGYDGKILSDVRSVYKPPKGSGIHPREAARQHSQTAGDVIKKSLDKAKVSIKEVDCIAYSRGPGLGPCLKVGGVVARALASYYNKPLVPVNHAIGHIELGCLLTKTYNPIVLLISGGHTLITSFSLGRWRIFGETLDLTIGQLVDQFGRFLGYASPSGRIIEEIARKGKKFIQLPYSVKGNDVSFSGLLTAAKEKVKKGEKIENICFSLQEVAFAMLCEAYERAIAFVEKDEGLVVGGVASNKRLAEMLKIVAERHGIKMSVVPPEFSADCGAQIAWTGALAFRAGVNVKPENADVIQSWRIDRVNVIWRS